MSFLVRLGVYAQSGNNNISIALKTDRYEFAPGNKLQPVHINQKINTRYRCNGYRTQIPFVELYDNNRTIDEVKIFVNGDRAKGIIPEYNYYSINDVFYSDARICYFSLPLEKKDSESEVSVKKTITDPRYLTSIYLDEQYSINQKTVEIVIPAWMHVEIKEFNFPNKGINKSSEEKNGVTTFRYAINNLPARKESSQAPGPSYLYPHILVMAKSAQPAGLPNVTYFKNLQDQYNWYLSLLKEVNNDSAAFKDRVKDLVKDKRSDDEKIRAVYNWVQANIRYIAFEDGIAGYKPAPAQDVYNRKYGDCKGMANLTKEMLKVLGLDARLCWIGTNHIAYDYSTPSLAVDNHMICSVKRNGKFVFLDATEKYIGYGEYAQRIQGRQVMIEDDEKYILENIPITTWTQNTETIKRTLKVDATNLTGTVSMNYKGESKEEFLFQLNTITNQKRDFALQEYISHHKSNYKIQNLKISNVLDWNGDVTIDYDLIYDHAVTEFAGEKFLDMDLTKEFADSKIDTGRSQNYLWPYKTHISHITELLIPDDMVVAALPEGLEIKTDLYNFNLKYLLSGNKLIYTKELTMAKPYIDINHFTQWNADVRRLNNFYNEQITLKKK